jgi:uncharacterized protein (TIGR02391 family)
MFLGDDRHTSAPDDVLIEAAEIVEPILDRVIPKWRTDVPADETGRWQQHREAAQRALVNLRRGAELREKLGDNAPTLNAGHLHPWVWEGARSMWQSGHFRQAVVDAAKRINAEAQNKLGTRALSETDLTNQAFSDDPPKPDRPRLRLPEDDDGKTARSVRRGIRAYAEGCFAAIRNPAAHDDLQEMPQDEALEQLAALSVLARWIERAEVLASR